MNTNLKNINPIHVSLDRVGIEEVSENLIEAFKNGELDVLEMDCKLKFLEVISTTILTGCAILALWLCSASMNSTICIVMFGILPWVSLARAGTQISRDSNIQSLI
jgi:hypothetical protein